MSQVEQIDIDAVPVGPKLDAAVAVEIMQYTRAPFEKLVGYLDRTGTFYKECPAYSTDANHVREVEAEIGRRGLGLKYAMHLARLLDLDIFNDDSVMPDPTGWVHFDGNSMFPLITATPEQRCRAAYKAVVSWTDGTMWKLPEEMTNGEASVVFSVSYDSGFTTWHRQSMGGTGPLDTD